MPKTTKDTKTKKKPLSVSKLKHKLDSVFSEYVRRIGFLKYGRCYTCMVRYESWKSYQNGHYYSRRYNSLRYDERNCRIQCAGCNIFKEGNKPVFAIRLINEYKGTHILATLQRISNQTKQFTTKELLRMIDKYEEKLLFLDLNE